MRRTKEPEVTRDGVPFVMAAHVSWCDITLVIAAECHILQLAAITRAMDDQLRKQNPWCQDPAAIPVPVLLAALRERPERTVLTM